MYRVILGNRIRVGDRARSCLCSLASFGSPHNKCSLIFQLTGVSWMEPKGFLLSALRAAGSAVTKCREQHNEVLELGDAIAVHITSRRTPC